eukprot:scaffold45_cov337-Pavlova_lutheri.AAC.35
MGKGLKGMATCRYPTDEVDACGSEVRGHGSSRAFHAPMRRAALLGAHREEEGNRAACDDAGRRRKQGCGVASDRQSGRAAAQLGRTRNARRSPTLPVQSFRRPGHHSTAAKLGLAAEAAGRAGVHPARAKKPGRLRIHWRWFAAASDHRSTSRSTAICTARERAPNASLCGHEVLEAVHGGCAGRTQEGRCHPAGSPAAVPTIQHLHFGVQLAVAGKVVQRGRVFEGNQTHGHTQLV